MHLPRPINVLATLALLGLACAWVSEETLPAKADSAGSIYTIAVSGAS
jgi:hypothetical protein